MRVEKGDSWMCNSFELVSLCIENACYEAGASELECAARLPAIEEDPCASGHQERGFRPGNDIISIHESVEYPLS